MGCAFGSAGPAVANGTDSPHTECATAGMFPT